MALIVKTQVPNEVLKRIYDDIENNRIDTWTVVDRDYFTAVPTQWYNKARMKKCDFIDERYLRFGIVKVSNVTMTKELYAVYHGRFAEMILAHCDELIDSVFITSQLEKGIDVFQ